MNITSSHNSRLVWAARSTSAPMGRPSICFVKGQSIKAFSEVIYQRFLIYSCQSSFSRLIWKFSSLFISKHLLKSYYQSFLLYSYESFQEPLVRKKEKEKCPTRLDYPRPKHRPAHKVGTLCKIQFTQSFCTHRNVWKDCEHFLTIFIWILQQQQQQQHQLPGFIRGGTGQLHSSPTSNKESWGKFKFSLNLNLNDIKILFFKPQSLNDFYSQTVENPGAEYLRWEKYLNKYFEIFQVS